jgi:hypothetical protein
MSEIYKALSKAQSKMKGAVKDSTNPHFRSRYADLESVIDALKAPFAEAGLSYYQSVSEDGQRLITTIAHESGETISGSVPLIIGKNDMQGVGSAITYARRYGLAALAGVAQTDDDGNAACEPPKPKSSVVPANFARQAEQFKQAIAFESRVDKAQAEREVIQAAEARMKEEPKPEAPKPDVFEQDVFRYDRDRELVVKAAKELRITNQSLKAHKEELQKCLEGFATNQYASILECVQNYFANTGEQK